MKARIELHVGFIFYICLLCLVVSCMLVNSSAQAQEAEDRPIENFISPPQLFPSEGVLRAAYEPLSVFDRISGKVIGQIRAKLLRCPPREGGNACGIPIVWYIKMKDGRRVELKANEVGYEQGALVSYKTTVLKGGWAWSNMEFKGGNFWMRTKIEEVTSFETLASAIQDFEIWCTRPGKCEPVGADMKKELSRMMAGQFQLRSCGEQTYAIDGVVKRGGSRYYKVTRTEVEKGTAQPDLPMTGYIPTRRKNGTHVGIFWPRGC